MGKNKNLHQSRSCGFVMCERTRNKVKRSHSSQRKTCATVQLMNTSYTLNYAIQFQCKSHNVAFSVPIAMGLKGVIRAEISSGWAINIKLMGVSLISCLKELRCTGEAGGSLMSTSGCTCTHCTFWSCGA